MNFYYFCVYLSFVVVSRFTRFSLTFFLCNSGFLFLASSAAVLFWHSLLSLVVFLVFPYFPRCCLLLHTTKLVYPFLLSNISGFSGAFWLHCSLEGAGGEMLGGWKSRVSHSQPVTIFHAVVSFSFTEILPLAVR